MSSVLAGYGPPGVPGHAAAHVNPHGITADLASAVHAAIQAHPHPQTKGVYGKVLAQLLSEQARAHAAGPLPAGSAAGGVASPEDNGAGGAMLGVPAQGAAQYSGPGGVQMPQEVGALAQPSPVSLIAALLARRFGG